MIVNTGIAASANKGSTGPEVHEQNYIPHPEIHCNCKRFT